MPRQKLPQNFKPTSMEDILAGRVDSAPLTDSDNVSSSENLPPRVLQIREAGRGFRPEFKQTHNEEMRFKLLDGSADDDPYWRRIMETIQELRAARTKIREREENGLPPNPSDVFDLKYYQRGLNEALPNFFRHGK